MLLISFNPDDPFIAISPLGSERPANSSGLYLRYDINVCKICRHSFNFCIKGIKFFDKEKMCLCIHSFYKCDRHILCNHLNDTEIIRNLCDIYHCKFCEKINTNS